MSAINIILTIIWAISGIGLVILILMHSGKGTGVSDMISSSMYNTSGSANLMEKNLDKLTLALAIIFIVCLLVMMIVFPMGAIS